MEFIETITAELQQIYSGPIRVVFAEFFVVMNKYLDKHPDIIRYWVNLDPILGVVDENLAELALAAAIRCGLDDKDRSSDPVIFAWMVILLESRRDAVTSILLGSIAGAKAELSIEKQIEQQLQNWLIIAEAMVGNHKALKQNLHGIRNTRRMSVGLPPLSNSAHHPRENSTDGESSDNYSKKRRIECCSSAACHVPYQGNSSTENEGNTLQAHLPSAEIPNFESMGADDEEVFGDFLLDVNFPTDESWIFNGNEYEELLL